MKIAFKNPFNARDFPLQLRNAKGCFASMMLHNLNS